MNIITTITGIVVSSVEWYPSFAHKFNYWVINYKITYWLLVGFIHIVLHYKSVYMQLAMFINNVEIILLGRNSIIKLILYYWLSACLNYIMIRTN